MSITTVEPPAAPLDPELAERLERMAARRSDATSPPGRRRHPARKSRAVALALSLLTTTALAGGFAAIDGPTSSVVTAAGGVVSLPAVPAAAMESVVNGDVFTNKWGPVQVQASFNADGSLASVDVIQSPFSDRKSVQINDRAVPLLNSEALTLQSARVDSVSGATYTSVDYEQSLQSAIDAARTAGITQLI